MKSTYNLSILKTRQKEGVMSKLFLNLLALISVCSLVQSTKADQQEIIPPKVLTEAERDANWIDPDSF